MEQRPTIWLFMEHRYPGVESALYKIQPPLDLSKYDQMIDSEGFMMADPPFVTFPDNTFLPVTASVTLGSKFYFFGGRHDYINDRTRILKTQVFDTDHPEQGLRTLAPMRGPKKHPCVFLADGKIYALGVAYVACKEKNFVPGSKGTGCFECYDPSSDQWQVLPDPPLPSHKWLRKSFSNCATVVGRRVFIGYPVIYVIFNLDKQDWDPLPPPEKALRFNCPSLFVQDSASLYRLCDRESFRDPVQVVKKTAPLTTTEQGDYDSSLLDSPCLAFGEEQVMAQDSDLEGNLFFTGCNFSPWRKLLHMGGRFFCYVVTAEFTDWIDRTIVEPESRGVWINFLEEVPAQTHDGNNKAKFRSLASFCYKITTDFDNLSNSVSCFALGTVPDSWIEAPLEKKHDFKLKHKTKESKELQVQNLVIATEQEVCKAEQRRHEVENAENILDVAWIQALLEKKHDFKPKGKGIKIKSVQNQSLVTPTEQKVCKAERRRHEMENSENGEAWDDKKRITVQQVNSRLAAELAKNNVELAKKNAELAKKNAELAKNEKLLEAYRTACEKSFSMLECN